MPEDFEFKDSVYTDGETTLKPESDVRIRLQGVKYEPSGIVGLTIYNLCSDRSSDNKRRLPWTCRVNWNYGLINLIYGRTRVTRYRLSDEQKNFS